MANPTLIAVSTVGSTANNNVASDTSATLTWQTGDVLVAVASNEGFKSATWSISNTGSGLSWTAQQIHNTTAADCGVAAWTAVASAGSSGTVTVAQSASQNMNLGVYQFRAPTGATIAVGNTKLGTALTSSPQQVSMLMTSADSSVVWAAGDWAAAAVESPSPAATAHTATTPGPSVSPTSGVISTRYTWYVDELDDETSTGSVNFGYTGSSSGPFSVVAVEVAITPSGGGGGATPAPTPPQLMMMGVGS